MSWKKILKAKTNSQTTPINTLIQDYFNNPDSVAYKKLKAVPSTRNEEFTMKNVRELRDFINRLPPNLERHRFLLKRLNKIESEIQAKRNPRLDSESALISDKYVDSL